MDIKELNDTLIAHQIIAFALKMQGEATTGMQAPARVETYIPAATKRYLELREFVKGCL